MADSKDYYFELKSADNYTFKHTFKLAEDGNYYYEENGKATKLDKTSQEGKKIVEKLLSGLSTPMMDVIGFDEKRENDTKERIIVEIFKQ